MRISNFSSFGANSHQVHNVKSILLGGALSLLTLSAACAASPVVGATYSPVPPVAENQAQVIVFRLAEQNGGASGPAHLYVDGGLHAALLPHGYSRVCVTPGVHSMEAYVSDAPLFAGKFSPATQVPLEGGKTYFAAVSADGSGELRPYLQVDAERLLEGAQEQRHVISRAAAAVPCVSANAGAGFEKQ